MGEPATSMRPTKMILPIWSKPRGERSPAAAACEVSRARRPAARHRKSGASERGEHCSAGDRMALAGMARARAAPPPCFPRSRKDNAGAHPPLGLVRRRVAGMVWEPKTGETWSSGRARTIPPSTLVPRLIAAGADLGQLQFVRQGSREDGRSRGWDSARNMSALEKEVQRAGDVALVVIDPVALVATKDSHKNAETRRDLQPLPDLSRATGAAALGVHHLAKGTAGPPRHEGTPDRFRSPSRRSRG